ncbi:MAG: CbiX/SirB N-terminal domain-containing protein [Proteobacteria bacterium]|nr:CbiX/SirB N-terminal domain-containing protein [Pseudomonadota bacterium]HQR04574.1 CbiX/SirB N-terminal domain-containing protein [Rhodocyclaceae bacterium]
MQGFILFGHGARNPEWALPFHRLRDAIIARRPDLPVCLGFLESMRPDFGEAVSSLAAMGVTEITVIPVFIAGGGHVKKDLPVMAAAAMDRHPGVSIAIAAAVGEAAVVVEAMAEYVIATPWQAGDAVA